MVRDRGQQSASQTLSSVLSEGVASDSPDAVIGVRSRIFWSGFGSVAESSSVDVSSASNAVSVSIDGSDSTAVSVSTVASG